MIFLAVIIGVLAVLGAFVVDRSQADRLMRSQKHRKVVVELHSGDTFDGLLVSADRNVLVLRSARLLMGATSQPTHIDGELLLPRQDVKFLQRP